MHAHLQRKLSSNVTQCVVTTQMFFFFLFSFAFIFFFFWMKSKLKLKFREGKSDMYAPNNFQYYSKNKHNRIFYYLISTLPIIVSKCTCVCTTVFFIVFKILSYAPMLLLIYFFLSYVPFCCVCSIQKLMRN